MKKCFVFIILFFSISVFSQAENLTSKDISKKLCKTWKLKEMKSNGKIMPFNLLLEIQYFGNNTFEMNSNGGIEKGKWEVEKNNNTYFIVVNDKESTELKSINESEFVISKSFESKPNSPEKMEVEYYFVLKN